MLPKVIFRRSWLYDNALARTSKFKKPSDARADKFIIKLEQEWHKFGLRILRSISQVTKLKWHEKEIVCYITWGVVPYSDPITLNLRSDIDTLTHELIHRIISEPENWKLIKQNWVKLMKKYSHQPQITRTHVAVHTIHAVILKKLFGEKRLQMEINKIKNPNYIRAWYIIQRDGYEKIIKILTSGLK